MAGQDESVDLARPAPLCLIFVSGRWDTRGMRTKLASVIIALGLVASMVSISPARAAIKAGDTCKKAGQTSTYNGMKFTCIKSGKKLVWNKGISIAKPKPAATSSPTPTPTETNPFVDDIAKATQAPGVGQKCDPVKNCPIGSIGPGGGIVFYDAKVNQPWGRYLEFAPESWSGSTQDPRIVWCNRTDFLITSLVSDPTLKATLGTEIGKGKANTNLMLAACTSSAAHFAKEYRGAGKSDWFIPSRDELNELCKFARSQGTGDPRIRCANSGRLIKGFIEDRLIYWSSSEVNPKVAWLQDFGDGNQLSNAMDYMKANGASVRPIRAFS